MSVNKAFLLEELKAFAKASGDHNPIHTNEEVARRLIFGSVIVHGIYALCKLLEYAFGLVNENVKLSIVNLQADFLKPIKVGIEVTLKLDTFTANEMSGVILDSNSSTVLLKVSCSLRSLKESALPEYSYAPSTEAVPKELSSEQMPETFARETKAFLDMSILRKLLPLLSERLVLGDILLLFGSSRIVGMKYPGLHSLYSSLNVIDTPGSYNRTDYIRYSLSNYDRRINRAEINMLFDQKQATVIAYRRPPPVQQLQGFRLEKYPRLPLYAKRRALVLGGSRGLGAAASLILAARGASVMITYNRGKREAETLANQINRFGGEAKIVQINVCNESIDNCKDILSFAPTHLYYFASPHIFAGERSFFSSGLYNQFCKVYVTKYVEIVRCLHKEKLRYVFYPSSIAIEEKPINMQEYVLAKVSGEYACDYLEKTFSTLRVFRPRLERVRTDQTASLLPVSALDCYDCLDPLFNEFDHLYHKENL
tara:strand:+ start:2575 stop:4023 length:1449 start_codon:yes stop_codon:yes gene_type:complete